MQKRIRRRQVPAQVSVLAGAIHPVLARVYRGRGIESCEQLNLSLEHLLSPTLLLNADRAATLLADALARDKRIVVIGDFDADGATSTTVAVAALRAFGGRHVDYLVPNRFEYGYGLTPPRAP